MRRVLMVLLPAAVAGVLLSAPNAWAQGGGGSALGGTTQTSGTQPGQTVKGGQTKTVNTCHLFSDGVSYGLSCGNGGAGGESFARILADAKQPVPTCWDTPWTQQELDQAGITDPTNVYVHRTCLNGDDPDLPDGLDTTTNPEIILPDQKPCDPEVTWPSIPGHNIALVLNDSTIDGKQPYHCFMTLSPVQTRVLTFGGVEKSTFPYPVLLPTPALQGSDGTSVSINARVNEPVALFDQTDTNDPPPQVNAGGVAMRAVLSQVDVSFPDGDIAQSLSSSPSKTCSVIAQPGDTPQSLASACWYKFTRTSAFTNSEAFNIQVESIWNVQYLPSHPVGGEWQYFNQVTKHQETSIKVGSVQALVVPN